MYKQVDEGRTDAMSFKSKRTTTTMAAGVVLLLGNLCLGIGFVGLLATLALGGSAVVALHILFGSFAVGSLAGGVISVYGYERGIRNA